MGFAPLPTVFGCDVGAEVDTTSNHATIPQREEVGGRNGRREEDETEAEDDEILEADTIINNASR